MYERSIGNYRLGSTYVVLGIRLKYLGYTNDALVFKRLDKRGVEMEEIKLDRKRLKV